MGSFLGKKIPDYNPFWEEDDYKDKPDYWKWFHLGYDEGYNGYEPKHEREEKLSQENEALRALIGTNYRLMRQEILEELKNGKLQEVGNPTTDNGVDESNPQSSEQPIQTQA